MDKNTQAYFLTVDWCKKGQRGIFCSKEGQGFRKQGEPHTALEEQTILGPFWIILAPKSKPFTEEELAEFTYFRPLGEYTNQYGIALKGDDMPIEREVNDNAIPNQRMAS